MRKLGRLRSYFRDAWRGYSVREIFPGACLFEVTYLGGTRLERIVYVVRSWRRA